MSHPGTDIKTEGAFFRKKMLLSMLVPGIFVFLMWLAKIIEILFDLDLTDPGNLSSLT